MTRYILRLINPLDAILTDTELTKIISGLFPSWTFFSVDDQQICLAILVSLACETFSVQGSHFFSLGTERTIPVVS